MKFGRFGGGNRGGSGGRGGKTFGDSGPRDVGPKPVSVGEKLKVKIEAVASKGDGIAKKEGFVIFVPGVSVGEEITVEIKEVKSRCAIAEKVSAGSDAPEEPSDDSKEEKTE
ncbi:TRAM domain-containing protein [Candidatus Micrarchaeota archaeon]|nr:TRAM domain-containing protein [Candidatus Micrarchaeota archaeon]